MTLKSLLASVLAGMLCVSCGPNEQSASQKRGGDTLAGAADTTKARPKNQPQQQQQAEMRLPEAPVERPAEAAGPAGIAITPGAAGPTSPVARPADTSDVPPAPKEAQWTIFCATIDDPAHVETARTLKAALIKQTGMKEWYILHEANQSRLYYGYYRSINDAADKAETARAQADRKRIDALENANKDRPFKACQFVQLSAPDPESPPEWNIVNVPADKVWTLMIAGYKDHPDRKKAAVETVRDARARGEEAYYFHGDNVSNVFIGAWPEDAVAEERIDPDANKRKGGRADLFVLPPGMKAEAGMRHKDGRDVAAVGQRLVAVDDGLKAKAEQYPTFALNGDTVVYKVKGKTRVEGTQVIRVPRPSENLFAEAPGANDGRGLEPQDPFSRPGVVDNAAAATPAAASTADDGSAQPSRPAPPSGASGGGKLRSLGK